jgi:hypothetical protein
VFNPQALTLSGDSATAGNLTGHDVALGDGEHPFDGCEIRWVAIDGEPLAQGAAGNHGIGVRHRPSIGRIERLGESIEELVIITEEIGGAMEDRHGITPGDVGEQGDQLVADSISPECRVGIRWVGHWCDPVISADGFGVAASQGEQWVRGARFDGAESGTSCSTQKPDEQCFSLIIGGVTGERPRRKDVLAGVAGTGFEIRAGAGFDMVDDERHADGYSDSLSVFGLRG